MTKQEKIQFVKDLFSGMETRIIQNIENGNIPEEWDGIELRWLVSDIAEENTYKGDKRRAKEYNNTVIVNNL
jgi:hypothetical protein